MGNIYIAYKVTEQDNCTVYSQDTLQNRETTCKTLGRSQCEEIEPLLIIALDDLLDDVWLTAATFNSIKSQLSPKCFLIALLISLPPSNEAQGR